MRNRLLSLKDFGVGEIAHANLLPKSVWCTELGELGCLRRGIEPCKAKQLHSAPWGSEKRTPTICLACVTGPQATISQKFLTTQQHSNFQPHIFFDSLKPDLPAEDEESNKDEDAGVEWDSEWSENERFGGQGLQAATIRFAVAIGDDPQDEDGSHQK